LADTGVEVTSMGRPYLGAAIYTQKFVISHVKNNWTKNWIAIAGTQPHAAYVAAILLIPHMA
jgi:hypothetical protein